MTSQPASQSVRFRKAVHLTHHATKRMMQRGSHLDLVEALLETGDVKRKDAEHWWIYRAFDNRADNLICAAVISREALIVKTIMTHWEAHDG
jgi:hypothetical protein